MHAAIGLTVVALALIGLVRVLVVLGRVLHHVGATLALASRSSRRVRQLRQQRIASDATLASLARRAEAGVVYPAGGAL